MNYRHLYHAGNFVEVFKHIVLTLLIEALQHKDTPFGYLDTHAGIGQSDLFSVEAQKTKEYNNGIALLLQQENFPTTIKHYLAAIQAVNSSDIKNNLQFYPGSPSIVRHLLRNNDRMILSELHPEDVLILKELFFYDKKVAVHHLDGYRAMKAFLPLKEKRGLILIDPPFEQTNEFSNIITALKTAQQRFATGIYAVWYPIKEMKTVNLFLDELKNTEFKKILQIELTIYPEDSSVGLNGSGMIIINPPWQFDLQLEQLLPWLWQVLSPKKQGHYAVKWLKKSLG